jgi:hypothetical protein
MLSDTELRLVEGAAANVRLSPDTRVDNDLGTCLVTTVVDFQMHETAVKRALEHFRASRAHRASTLEDFEELLAGYPDTREGNEELAEALFGYRMWTRMGLLRDLVRFLRDEGVTDLAGLRAWAESSEFKRDFQGQVRYSAGGRTYGLGPAVYSWLVMRLGVNTLKPDSRLHAFVETAIGRWASDADVAAATVSAAARIGVPPRLLHWSICQQMRA